ncbi:MAG: hypothetical protein AUK54_00320 [Helicobacteraceae bacterium CG2_30_36_10]|nr:MAG: hypothetical protein AUK54_00320 [Helicobacteraceae bacterium CG2_30_36_10]
MYYVIKRVLDTPLVSFMGFKVPKYIASKNSANVIFEFTKDGKVVRKWIKKEEIILLTKNQELFLKTMRQFKSVEEMQQKLVDAAREQLDQCIESFSQTMSNELEEFNRDDMQSILKSL